MFIRIPLAYIAMTLAALCLVSASPLRNELLEHPDGVLTRVDRRAPLGLVVREEGDDDATPGSEGVL